MVQYRYKKGVGWVPGPEFIKGHFTRNGYTMELTRRRPEVGEYYYSMLVEEEDLDPVFDDMQWEIGPHHTTIHDVGKRYEHTVEEALMTDVEFAVITYYGPEQDYPGK